MDIQNKGGYLTTHILDTARGCPAAGLSIDLYRCQGDERVHLKSVVTNDDGRTDGPMLAGEDFTEGQYELLFHVGEYHQTVNEANPFLDQIPIRFGINDASQHYHVPLLVSPFSYSTYRGS